MKKILSNKLPKVSIYILNYNYGKYIANAINSCVKQSFKDIEIIIIDDGSTDNSKKIIQSFAVKYPYIVCRFNKNQGLIKSCNFALQVAKGKYILRLDADDWLDKNAIEIMYNIMEKNKNLELLFPDYYEVDSSGKVLHLINRHNFEKVNLLDTPAHGACTLFRRKTLLDSGGYDENFSCQDGVEIWLRFYKKFKVSNINLPLFYYRRHGYNLTTQNNKILNNRNKILYKYNDKKTKAIAYIPIRGSKYDKFSNDLKFLGKKRLIDWTLDCLLKVKNLDKIFVSSPDKNILNFVKNKKNKKLIAVRSNINYSAQAVTVETNLIKFLRKLKNLKKLQATFVLVSNLKNPFKNYKHIENSINTCSIYNLDLVLGVNKENSSLFSHDGNTLKPLRQYDEKEIQSFNKKKISIRIEKEEIYRERGNFKLYNINYLLSKNSNKQPIVGHENLDNLSSFSISSEFDWFIGKKIANNLKLIEKAI